MTGGRPALSHTTAAVAAAVMLWLPWWRPARAPVLIENGPTTRFALEGSWSGWELAGFWQGCALVALATGGVVVAHRRGPATPALLSGAAGAAAVGTAGAVLIRWGASIAPGAWLCAAAGLAALTVALRSSTRTRSAIVAATLGLVVAVAVSALPGPAERPDGARGSGPFERVIGVGGSPGERSGEADLPGATGSSWPAILDGRVVLVARDSISAPAGRAEVLARAADGRIRGLFGHRVARYFPGEGRVMVTGPRVGDPLAVVVHGVVGATAVGADGTMWLRSRGNLHLLDLADHDGVQTLMATDLPVVTPSAPLERAAETQFTLVEGGALRFVGGRYGARLERLTPAPGGFDVTLLAGGVDPSCGATRTAADTFLPTTSPLAVAADGGIWFVRRADDRVHAPSTAPSTLVHRSPDGVLRHVPQPVPGTATALLIAPDGALTLLVDEGPDRDGGGLWRLPDAAAALVDLPGSPADCVAAAPPAGPPVTLVPLAEPRRVGQRGLPENTVMGVAADGNPVPVGVRRGTGPPPVPDGAGGVWWIEDTPKPGGYHDPSPTLVLVHGRPGMPEDRRPGVPHPSGRMRAHEALIPAFGGREPLFATATGAYRIGGDTAVRVVAGDVTDGVVRADGRGWYLADGRVLAVDGDRVLGPVIDAGERRADRSPLYVQLARGVAPAQLALPDAAMGLDADGRALVVSGGVVLAVSDAGTVTAVAQDPRIEGPFTVDGGLVMTGAGAPRRIVLPA